MILTTSSGAINAIKHMQKIAFNALQLYGFTPRGNLVE